MGLIMLILIGTVPTAYALNHAVTKKQSQDFVAVSEQAGNTLNKYVSPNAVIGDPRRRHRFHPHQGIYPQHHAGAAPAGKRYRK